LFDGPKPIAGCSKKEEEKNKEVKGKKEEENKKLYTLHTRTI
jgi:hypothetical protein